MNDEDKPFICYRKSRWNMQITPRNGSGWLAMALWVAGLLAIIHALIWLIVTSLGETGLATVLLSACIIGITGVWSVAMIRWMLARSEIISTDDVLAFKREKERQRGKGRDRRG